MRDFFNKSIDELLHSDTEDKSTDSVFDVTQQEYLAEMAAMRDFTPPEAKTRWPKPIGPLWKN